MNEVIDKIKELTVNNPSDYKLLDSKIFIFVIYKWDSTEVIATLRIDNIDSELKGILKTDTKDLGFTSDDITKLIEAIRNIAGRTTIMNDILLDEFAKGNL